MSEKGGGSAPDPKPSFELPELELAPPRPRPSHKVFRAPSAPELEPLPQRAPSLPDNDVELGHGWPSPDTALGLDVASREVALGSTRPEVRTLRGDRRTQDPLEFGARGGLDDASLELDLPDDDQLAQRVASTPATSGSDRSPARIATAVTPSTRTPGGTVSDAEELAGYGAAQPGFGAARYVAHVVRRMLVLRRERRAVEHEARARSEAYEAALGALGRALLDDPAVRAHESLRAQVASVEEQQVALAELEAKTHEADANAAEALKQLAAERAALEEQLAPYVEREREAEQAHAASEAELARRRAKVQRAEIELRALGRASVPPPGRTEQLEGERAERRSALDTWLAAHAETAAALGRARREVALRRGALDALTERERAQYGSAEARKLALTRDIARAEHALSAALCALAEAAEAVGVAQAAATQVATLRTSEAALDALVEKLARYDRALAGYDRDAMVRGALYWFALALALLLLVRALF